jgi:HSP20 family protein
MNDLMGLHSSLDRLFSDMVGEDMFPDRDRSARGGFPVLHLPVDIVEVENGFRIQAPVPGFKPEEVEVTFSDGVLTINAKHSEERKQEEGNYLRRETAYGNYLRQISLPGNIKADEITATFDDGVLTVQVPRAPKPEPAKIQVQHSSSSEGSSKRKVEAGSAKS